MKSREIALCGMLNALAVVLMNLGSLVPLATFCTPLLAMLVLLPVLEEYGPRMGWAAWVSVSILSLLLVTDRETALVYVFFGWYPMVRPKVAAIKSKVLRFGVKLLICNGLIFTLYGLVLRLMGLTADLGGHPADERPPAGSGKPCVFADGPGFAAHDSGVDGKAAEAVFQITTKIPVYLFAR